MTEATYLAELPPCTVDRCAWDGCTNQRMMHNNAAKYCDAHSDRALREHMKRRAKYPAQRLRCAVDECTNMPPKLGAKFCNMHTKRAWQLTEIECVVCGKQWQEHKRLRTLPSTCLKCTPVWRPRFRNWRSHGMDAAQMAKWVAHPQCWICGVENIEWELAIGMNAMNVDHDHKCCYGGRGCVKCVRGLAHQRCNAALGKMEHLLDRIGTAQFGKLVTRMMLDRMAGTS